MNKNCVISMTLGLLMALSAKGAVAQAVELLIATNEGKTLYIFDRDSLNTSNCYGGCAAVWPPALSAVQTLAAPLGTTIRKDGTFQITYQGKPLYTYADDEHPGDKNGDGIGGIWHIGRP